MVDLAAYYQVVSVVQALGHLDNLFEKNMNRSWASERSVFQGVWVSGRDNGSAVLSQNILQPAILIFWV